MPQGASFHSRWPSRKGGVHADRTHPHPCRHSSARIAAQQQGDVPSGVPVRDVLQEGAEVSVLLLGVLVGARTRVNLGVRRGFVLRPSAAPYHGSTPRRDRDPPRSGDTSYASSRSRSSGVDLAKAPRELQRLPRGNRPPCRRRDTSARHDATRAKSALWAARLRPRRRGGGGAVCAEPSRRLGVSRALGPAEKSSRVIAMSRSRSAWAPSAARSVDLFGAAKWISFIPPLKGVAPTEPSFRSRKRPRSEPSPKPRAAWPRRRCLRS